MDFTETHIITLRQTVIKSEINYSTVVGGVGKLFYVIAEKL